MVKIMSVNARGLRDKTKREAIFDFHRTNSDILIVQETHSSINDELQWASEWGGKVLMSHGAANARGIAVFFTKNIFSSITKPYSDDQGRTIIFDLEQNYKVVTIAAIYAPNEDCPKYFSNLKEIFSR